MIFRSFSGLIERRTISGKPRAHHVTDGCVHVGAGAASVVSRETQALAKSCCVKKVVEGL